jgi:dTDP-4-dehydrorhamnose 3,5-epimerase
MIDGVMIKNLKVVPDERGWLMEIMRCDDVQFKQFGQVYLSVAVSNVVKAWHYHKKQTDNFACIKGMMQVVLFDDREDSLTKGKVMELFIGEKNPKLITVPPRVWHGFKAIHGGDAYFLSIPDYPYNSHEPDEFRLPADSDKIPFKWNLMQGLKHG